MGWMVSVSLAMKVKLKIYHVRLAKKSPLCSSYVER